MGVTDGDTLSILIGGLPVTVRLAGIDAPEKRQPFEADSKAALSALVFGEQVTIHYTGKDLDGRTVADVFQAGRWVNLEMVRVGLAWRYVKYSSDSRLIDAEAAARKAKRGLWTDSAPVAPWKWLKH